MSNFHKLGDILVELFSNYITVSSQDDKCCTVKQTLNAWGPYLAKRHIRSIVEVLKYTTEYKEFKIKVPDRSLNKLLTLFVKKAIRKSLLDTKATSSYTLVTPTEKEPNDAIKEGQQPTDNLDEHSQRDEVRQTSEASNRNRYEQSRNVQRNRKRKKR